MKKLLILITSVLLIFALFACNNTSGDANTDDGGDSITDGEGENNGTGDKDDGNNENSGSDTENGENNDENGGSDTENGGEGENSGTDTEECEHQYELQILTPAKALADGSGIQICALCSDEYSVTLPATKTLKVLAVGNSFSVDAMEYLWGICNDGGIENIVLGNLYIGGCSLDTHWSKISSNANAYKYYKNTSGKWTSTDDTALYDALVDEDWDIITVQQASQNSGKPETYSKLNSILNYLRVNCTNENAEFYWHMTWAYQSDSTHSGFAGYNSDQNTMYQAIINATQTQIATKEAIAGIIPSGTAIQNLRTSYLGDKLTRDGYHLNYTDGRYTAALTWFAYLTGGSVEKISWVPESNQSVRDNLAPIREAVTNALATPYSVTNSTHLVKPEKTDADRLRDLGLDPSEYKLLEFDYTVCAYWNSSTDASLKKTASNSQYYIAIEKLTKEMLPEGAVIIIDEGYQYRPDGWLDENGKKPESRPGNVSSTITLITASWWSNFALRGINFSYIGAKTVMSAADIVHIRIYVPVS